MRIDFYHLEKWTLEKALPQIMEKVFASSVPAIIKVGSEQRADYMNALLWTYGNNSWLPHGTEKDGNAALQPVFITENDENPNGAKIIVLLDGEDMDFATAEYDRVIVMFDGKNTYALTWARGLWKKAKENKCERFYWQQDAQGAFKQQQTS